MTRTSQVTQILREMRSPRFSSHQQATQAARFARAGAVSAPIEDDPADTPPADLSARRRIAIERDQLVAERWLDEGRSDTKEARTS